MSTEENEWSPVPSALTSGMSGLSNLSLRSRCTGIRARAPDVSSVETVIAVLDEEPAPLFLVYKFKNEMPKIAVSRVGHRNRLERSVEDTSTFASPESGAVGSVGFAKAPQTAWCLRHNTGLGVSLGNFESGNRRMR